MKKEKYPLVSIVMLNYNGLKYLKQTIKPILNQDYPHLEFIIVDNGSTDGSIEYIKKQSKIRLIENEKNLGYSKGKNIGVKNAKGKYVLLLDEDILTPNKKILSCLLKEYRQINELGFLSMLLSQKGSKETSLYGGYIKTIGIYHNKKLLLKKLKGQKSFQCASPDGGGLFFEKKIFKKLGGYDESQPYYIDVGDLGIRASIYGYKSYVYCEHLFLHLGVIRKTNLDQWCWKYKYNLSGIMRVIIKNFTLRNAVKMTLINYIMSILKTIKNMFTKKSLKVLSSFLFSNVLLLKNLKDTLKQRKKIQSKRKIKEDIFLKIKAPKFN